MVVITVLGAQQGCGRFSFCGYKANEFYMCLTTPPQKNKHQGSQSGRLWQPVAAVPEMTALAFRE